MSNYTVARRLLGRAFSCLLIVSLLCCSRKEDLPQSILSKRISVPEARKWLTEFAASPSGRKADADFLVRTPIWERAFEYTFSEEFKAVVVPMNMVRKKGTTGYKEAWVYRDSKDRVQVRIVEYILPNSMLKGKQEFRSIRTNFSGVMRISDWDGNFIGGLLYEDGKIKNQIVDENGVKAKKGLLSGGRTKDLSCSFTPTVTSSYFYVVTPYGVSETTYSYSIITWQVQCFYSINLDLDLQLLPPDQQIPYYPNGNDDPMTTFRMMTPCDGYRRARELSNTYGVEFNGLVLSNNTVLIFPAQGNTFTTSAWSGPVYSNVYVNGVLRNINYDIANGIIEIWVPGFPETLLRQYVVRTFHTHPCPLGGISAVYGPSPADLSFAATYPNTNHEIWTCEGTKIGFNQLGMTYDQPHGCP